MVRANTRRGTRVGAVITRARPGPSLDVTQFLQVRRRCGRMKGDSAATVTRRSVDLLWTEFARSWPARDRCAGRRGRPAASPWGAAAAIAAPDAAAGRSSGSARVRRRRWSRTRPRPRSARLRPSPNGRLQNTQFSRLVRRAQALASVRLQLAFIIRRRLCLS